MSQYRDYPQLASITEAEKATAQRAKITNLILCFLDFHVSEDDFAAMKASNFKDTNIVEVVNDLKHYGYSVEVPETAEDYRTKVYPLFIELHAKAGFYGLQIPVGGVPFDENGDLTEEAQTNLKRQREVIEAAGLKISAVGGNFTEDWKGSIKPQMLSANALGSKFLYGPLSTVFAYFPEGVAYGDDAIAWVNEKCEAFSKLVDSEIGPLGDALDVTLCDEPLQRFERMPVRLKEAVKMALMTKSNRLKIMIDMCHEFADGEGPEIYEGYVNQLGEAGKLQGIHISAVHRGKVYESWFNKQYFQEFFKPVFANGYDGEISIETFDAVMPVRDVVKVSRNKFVSPMSVAINNLVYSARMLEDIK